MNKMTPPLRLLFLSWLVVVAAIAVAVPVGALATEVRQVTSPGGITGWLVEDHANPVISVRFAFVGGAALDPPAREGLANLVSATLDEGAGDLTSTQFQRILEDESITLNFDASKDAFYGNLRTLSENLDRAAGLLNLALTRPRFDDEPVQRIKSQIIAGIRQSLEQPGDMAAREFFQSMFADHGYAHASDGTEAGIQAATREELVGFVKRHIGRNNVVIGVAGDITPDRLTSFLDKAFGDLAEKVLENNVDDIHPLTHGTIKVIHRPVPQSVVMFGQEGLKRDDPDYYAALLVNHILGGGSFTSRIYTEVREKRGLAYSVGTSIFPLDHASLWLGQAGTENGAVGETVAIIRQQWRNMAQSGVTAAELDDAKTYMTGAFPLRFTSSGAIATILVAMQLDHLGIDYIDRRNGYIAAVDVDTANRVARRLLDETKLDFVIVGEPQGLPPGSPPGSP